MAQLVTRKRISDSLLEATRKVASRNRQKSHVSTGGYLHEKRHGSPSEFSLGNTPGATFLGRLGFTSLPTTPFRVHVGTVHVDRRGTASITLMGGTGSKLRARVTTAAPHRRYRSAIYYLRSREGSRWGRRFTPYHRYGVGWGRIPHCPGPLGSLR